MVNLNQDHLLTICPDSLWIIGQFVPFHCQCAQLMLFHTHVEDMQIIVFPIQSIWQSWQFVQILTIYQTIRPTYASVKFRSWTSLLQSLSHDAIFSVGWGVHVHPMTYLAGKSMLYSRCSDLLSQPVFVMLFKSWISADVNNVSLCWLSSAWPITVPLRMQSV